MAIVRATGPLLDEIFDHTYPIWGDGLSRRAYAQWNHAQERTEWGRRHLMRIALVENGHLLATAKRYDLRLMLDGRVTPAVGIGAVFTPVALRGRGHARAIIDALMESAREGGAELALLFSEIGPAYYERMGFTVIPIETADIHVATKPGAPAILVRAGEDDDARQVATIYAQRASAFRLALISDDDQVRYTVTKKRLFVGLDQGARRSVEYFVSEEGRRAVAFVLLQITRGTDGRRDAWSLEACGDADPSGARIGAILQVLLARSPATIPPLIQGWWPLSMQPPQLSVVGRAPAGEVMMIKPIVGGLPVPPLSAGDVIFWHGDAF